MKTHAKVSLPNRNIFIQKYTRTTMSLGNSRTLHKYEVNSRSINISILLMNVFIYCIWNLYPACYRFPSNF